MSPTNLPESNLAVLKDPHTSFSEEATTDPPYMALPPPGMEVSDAAWFTTGVQIVS